MSDSTFFKLVGVLAGAFGIVVLNKRIQYESDPTRSQDPVVVKGITYGLFGLLAFTSYHFLTLKPKA